MSQKFAFFSIFFIFKFSNLNFQKNPNRILKTKRGLTHFFSLKFSYFKSDCNQTYLQMRKSKIEKKKFVVIFKKIFNQNREAQKMFVRFSNF